MKCSSCGAEIADKAIVCYRCGTPTAIPAAPARSPLQPRRRPVWPTLLALIVIVALSSWVIVMTPADSGARYAAYAALAVAAVAVLTFVARRSGPRRGPS